MDNSFEITYKGLMGYLHREFKNLLTGILCLIIGIAGMLISNWLWGGIIDGYSGRVSIVIFILPVFMVILIIIGVISILSFPFGVIKKSKHSKFFKTEAGGKIIADFVGAACYFEDEIRVGKTYFYKRGDDFYSFCDIEQFKLVKKDKSIRLMYKSKNKPELTLKSFDKDNWRKSKNDVLNFFENIKKEHPEISLEIL